MGRPSTLMFDRLTTTPLVVAEGGLSDADVFLSKDRQLYPAVFDLNRVDFLMRLLEPSLAEWRYELFPNLAPPPYDCWFEWYNHAAAATYGVFLRGRDVAEQIDESARGMLLAHWLVGGHLFRERPQRRDIIHLGHFSFGVEANGRLVTAYPVTFANNWEREFDLATADQMPGFFAPVMFALTLLHDPTLRLVDGAPEEFAQRSWGKRHKRTLARWREIDNEATITALVASASPDVPFPVALSTAAADFAAAPPALDDVATHSWHVADVLVGLQKFPGTIDSPGLVLP